MIHIFNIEMTYAYASSNIRLRLWRGYVIRGRP